MALKSNRPVSSLSIDDDNFINVRIRPFHGTDQVWKNIGQLSTEPIGSYGLANMYEDDSFGRDYDNQNGFIGDPFSQNNDADVNYIYSIHFYLFIYNL